MFEPFKNHIETQLPNLFDSKLLVACSGGLDSTVLVQLTHQLGLDIAIAHCNFNLRGKESKADEAFVKDLASRLGLHFHSKSFDTNSELQKRGGSIQMVTRDLRYEWFETVLQSEGYDNVLTAHHLDDSLETFLINLSRGTGIDGLTGIPSQNQNVIRPMLPFSRIDIFDYAKTHKMKWREDSSNVEDKYLRNKIRHDIVPRLKELHPNFLGNFKSTQRRLRGTAAILENTKHELQSKLFKPKKGQLRIAIAELQKFDPLKEYLYLLFGDFGFTEWDDLAHLLHAMSGKRVISKTHILVKDRDDLILSELTVPNNESYLLKKGQDKLEVPIKLKIENVETMGSLSDNVLYVDKETLNYPLKLRKWENGDYFYPLGMKGKKKLSKFFKDEKIDRIAKESQWLLCSDDGIIWVVGRRADDRFKVRESTKDIIKITWLD